MGHGQSYWLKLYVHLNAAVNKMSDIFRICINYGFLQMDYFMDKQNP
jgi:hypothetical protein